VAGLWAERGLVRPRRVGNDDSVAPGWMMDETILCLRPSIVSWCVMPCRPNLVTVGQRIRPRGLGRNAADVDDAPALGLLRLHDADRLACAEKRRGDVDGERLVPVVERDVLGVLVGGDA